MNKGRQYFHGGEHAFSKIPLTVEKAKGKKRDMQILRAGIIAELDAINLYEQMTMNAGIRSVLLDIVREEKTHVGEFQALLLMLDREKRRELEQGKREVTEVTGDDK